MDNIIVNARYEIRKQLSKKAGRRTFLAQDLHSQTLVVIKILLFDQDFQWEELKLFEREAKTLQNLTHPSIPQYLDYFEVKDGNYQGFALVQTYIDALSLDILIQQGRRFSEPELIELADKLLSILTYLHEQIPMVIHRDIKPSNILIANRSGHSIGDIYLVDFGSVQTAATKDNGTITIVGSYGYIPLEQFGGQAVPASDLYSLGVTIIYLATGTHPAEIPQVNGQIKFSTPQLSRRFQKWLEKIIQPHLDRRFDSAKLAQTALNSSDGSFGNYPELKPKDTQVQLQRDRDQLEIILPKMPKNFFTSIVSTIFTALLSGLFWSIFLGAFLVSIIQSIGLSLNLSYLIIFIFFSIYVFLQNLPMLNINIAKIVVDSDEINAFNIFGLKKLTNLRSEISLLGYSPSYEFNEFWDNTGKQLNRGKVITEPELFIYAGSTKYSITKLSAAELSWIGQELSEFLDLELQIIYPIPKVPPEPSSCGGGC
ncbi:MAG TPA: serine/threonine-protein kinase [Oculatellaceae cyanobacterium]|jgi:serine/threonine protein kinase